MKSTGFKVTEIKKKYKTKENNIRTIIKKNQSILSPATPTLPYQKKQKGRNMNIFEIPNNQMTDNNKAIPKN